MNSYSFGLSSPLWLLLLLVIAAAALAFWSYRITVPPVSKRKKALLIALRTTAVTLLLFVLFEPVLTIVSGSQVQPKLAVLLDNSQSAAMDDFSGSRKKDYRKAVENTSVLSLGEEKLDVLKFSAFARPVEDFTFDSLDFKGSLTDISTALKKAGENAEKENVRAYLLISDGAFNQGANPLYEAEALGKPVFTVGIGSQQPPKDLSVQTILTNEAAYIDNPVPVNVRISASGYQEGETDIKILDNGKEFDSQKITIHPDKENYSLFFEYMPKTEGVRKITVSASQLPDEATVKNNRLSEYIKVLENKRKIALFAGAPSPDVSFVTQALRQEKGVEIKQFIHKKNSEFYGQPPNEKELSESEMFILIGFPAANTPARTIDLIKGHLAKGKPVLFISSRFLDYGKLKPLEDYLPFRTISSNTREFTALPDFTENASSHPLLKVNGEDIGIDEWNKLPPLFRTETFVRIKPETKVLSGVKVNNVSLKEPMIITRNFQNYRSIAIIAYGVYRWKLLGYGAEMAKNRIETPDLFQNLVNNSVRWLSVGRKEELITVKTSREFYTLGEKAEFLGQVYDEAYSPIDDAVITVSIEGAEEKRTLILNSAGNGRYTGSVEGLPEGDFYFRAVVESDGRKIGSDEGRFAIGETALEFQSLTMNKILLENIALKTGGSFYLPDEAGSFLEDLHKKASFEPRNVTTRSEFSFWNLPWLFAAAVLLFALEWFIRKRSGMV